VSAPEGRRKAAEAEELLRLLRTGWEVEARVVAVLPGDVDRNLRVRDAQGRDSLLKVAAPGTDAARWEAQAAALDHLATRLPGGTVPRVLATKEGRPFLRARIGREERLVRRLSWLEGTLVPHSAPHGARLFRSWGEILGRVDAALEGFRHPAARRREDPWDPARAEWAVEEVASGGAWDAGPAQAPDPPMRRTLLEEAAALWQEVFLPARDDLPRAILHADGNEYNLMVDRPDHPTAVTALMDFGDMTESCRVVEAAVAGAYAACLAEDPVGALAEVVAGYHGVRPLSPEEVRVLYPLARMRLVVSVLHSARRRRERPHDPYVTVSEAPAWRTLGRLHGVHPRLVEARLRTACGWEATAGADRVRSWVAGARDAFHPVLPTEHGAPGDWPVLDLSVGSPFLGADPSACETGRLGRAIEEHLEDRGTTVGVGRWDEARPIYLGPLFSDGDHPMDPHRTVHLGLDLFVAAGTELWAPLDGVVESVADNGAGKEYGPVLLLRHEPEGVPTFWTLWGHLDAEVLDRLTPGDRVAAGDLLARVGAPPRNGDWPPHPHVQLVLDLLDQGHDIPGVSSPAEREVRLALSPNPAPLLGLDDATVVAPRHDPEALLPRRRARTGRNLSLSYARPLHLVRGWMQYLYDQEGRGWLDLYNNVPHVGHSHPRVAEAVARQTSLLATNTRYLSRVRLEYLEQLAAHLPESLPVIYLVNSASEANELALRIARTATGRRDLVVQEAGYHGHTTTLVDASPYKARGPGGSGTPAWVHTVPLPDPYRGPHRRQEAEGRAEGRADVAADEELGRRYAADVARTMDELVRQGRPPGAFLAETFPSVGGQIVPPAGYLRGAYEAVRRAGGLAIADEVQTGFGRLGPDAFWAFECQDAVPDMVVLGKPMANGFPLGAVAVRRELAEAFDNGMEYFSTFGGNPVACAAGQAVLEVLTDERLPERAGRMGDALLEGLWALAAEHPVVGDVRGRGLFLGVELVADPDARTPAPRAARYLVERLREEGVLAGTDGPDRNVLKLRGPLSVGEVDVARTLAILGRILEEPFLARRTGGTTP